MIEKRVKRAAQEVSMDMLRGHMPENKMVCPKDERICLLTLRRVLGGFHFVLCLLREGL